MTIFVLISLKFNPDHLLGVRPGLDCGAAGWVDKQLSHRQGVHCQGGLSRESGELCIMNCDIDHIAAAGCRGCGEDSQGRRGQVHALQPLIGGKHQERCGNCSLRMMIDSALHGYNTMPIVCTL